MIQFIDFHDDIDFMAALFYNDILNNVDIYEIAIHLTNKIFVIYIINSRCHITEDFSAISMQLPNYQASHPTGQ
jgi:hypothetical protein